MYVFIYNWMKSSDPPSSGRKVRAPLVSVPPRLDGS